MKWTTVCAITIVSICAFLSIFAWQVQETKRTMLKERIAERNFGYGYVSVDKQNERI